MRSGREQVEQEGRLALAIQLLHMSQRLNLTHLDHRQQNPSRVPPAPVVRDDDRALRTAFARRVASRGVMQRIEIFMEHVAMPFRAALGQLDGRVILPLGRVHGAVRGHRYARLAFRVVLHRQPERHPV